MLFSNSVYTLVAAALIGSAVAKDRTECYTAMTSRRPRNVPTQYTTEYTACTKTLWSTKTVTTTPKPTTVTHVDYSYATVTDGYKGVSTTTKTSTVVLSTTAITFSTSTTTSTVTAFAQSVVPAPAMFTPIQDSLPGSTFTNTSVAAAPRNKRSEHILGKRDYSSNKYPKMVLCHKYTANKYCAEKRVTTTKTVTAKKPTVTVKTTKKSTSTVCPDAKRTVTTTKTTTTTSTSVSTSVVPKTVTTASIVGTTTIFEVCLSTRNYANEVSATPIINLNPIPADREPLEAVTVVENAFQCCNAALRARGNLGDLITSPQIFVFDSQRRGTRVGDGEDDAPQDTGGICSIFGASTCPANQADNQYGVVLDDEPPEEGEEQRRITVGNAPCGEGVPDQQPGRGDQ